MSKTKAIFLVALANIVFWGGLALALYLAKTSELFQKISFVYVEIWFVVIASTYGLYKVIREQL